MKKGKISVKGIIMAGGAGSRLRPLTCGQPKPMVPVLNKPVMHYSIELLKKYGIKDIGVTLQYLPGVIEGYFGDGSQYGVNLHYYIEETPLGTAGSVKNAKGLLDETFVVVSGDALTNIDLSRAIEFHRNNKSIATLILKKEEVPLEYGVVVTDSAGRITRFLEKPGWDEVFSDTINTGIYILEPGALEYFEDGIKFDFSKDLFPMILERQKPIFGYIAEEYWCDIGDIGPYLKSHFDVLDGKVGIIPDLAKNKNNLWVEEGVHIHPDAIVQGPCYIGRNTRIEGGAIIHPYTVIGENNHIGGHSSIKKSVLWNHNILGRNVEIRGSILCNSIRVDNNVSIFEGSAIGENTYLHRDVTIKPDVKVWPDKVVEQGVIAKDNIIWGTRLRRTFFGKDGIRGHLNTDIDNWFVARIGSAYGTELDEGDKISISSDSHNASKMLKYSAIGGALATGIEVIDIGSVITPVARYAVRYLGLRGGIHIECGEDDPSEVHIHLIGKKGANLPMGVERKIENMFITGDLSFKPPVKIHEVSFIEDIPIFYTRNLISQVNKDAIKEKGYQILLETGNDLIWSFFNNIAMELGLQVDRWGGSPGEIIPTAGYDLTTRIDEGGGRIQLYDKKGDLISEEIMTGLISLRCLKEDSGIDVIIPYTASVAIEKMAEAHKSNIIRSKTKKQAMMEEVIRAGDSDSKTTMDRFMLHFDGIAATIGIIDLMATEDRRLSDLVGDIPKMYMSIKDIECPFTKKGKVMRSLIENASNEKNDMELYEGIKINEEKGWALILPDPDEPKVRIYTEGMSEEYAEELCDFYREEIEKIRG